MKKFISRLAFLGIFVVGIAIIGVIATSGNSSPASATASGAVVVDEDGQGVVPVETIFDVTAFEGTFAGNGPFTVVGEVTTVSDDLGQRVLRFSDDFRTNRGPQLAVILRSDSGQSISLGALQSPTGAQVYAIPDQTDLTVFNQVQVWDLQGDIDFGRAFLSPVDA